MPRFVYLALILLSLIWGGSFYFIKMLLQDYGPWTIAFLRSTSGWMTVVVIMLLLRQPFGFRGFPWLQMSAMAIINTAIPWALIGTGETHLTSSMASILNATTPLWSMVVGMLMFRNRTTFIQWIGLAVATVGLLELLGIRPGSGMEVSLLGFACLVSASFCYGIGSQLSKRILNGSSTMYQTTFGTLFICSLASGVMAFATEPVPLVRIVDPVNAAMVVGLGIFGSGIAYILFYYIVQKGSAEFATMVTYLVPCTALIWGAVLLDEAVTWRLALGLLIILAGVFLAGRSGRRRKGSEGGGNDGRRSVGQAQGDGH